MYNADIQYNTLQYEDAQTTEMLESQEQCTI